jgi:hypothetical protein
MPSYCPHDFWRYIAFFFKKKELLENPSCDWLFLLFFFSSCSLCLSLLTSWLLCNLVWIFLNWSCADFVVLPGCVGAFFLIQLWTFCQYFFKIIFFSLSSPTGNLSMLMHLLVFHRSSSWCSFFFFYFFIILILCLNDLNWFICKLADSFLYFLNQLLNISSEVFISVSIYHSSFLHIFYLLRHYSTGFL